MGLQIIRSRGLQIVASLYCGCNKQYALGRSGGRNKKRGKNRPLFGVLEAGKNYYRVFRFLLYAS
jgi:hypothetical protein